MKNFETVLKEALVEAYISEYGKEAWEKKTDEERSETLHELLAGFLTATKKGVKSGNINRDKERNHNSAMAGTA